MHTIFENLDVSGEGPLYRRLKAAIAEAVANGKLERGAALPPERDLAEASGVSRVTVRRAIAELTREGLLTRRQGAGTFVARPVERIEQSLKRLSSFTEDMQARGMKPHSQWLERGLMPASDDEARRLGIAAGTQIARLSRIRFADNMPMAIEHSALPQDVLDAPQEVNGSLYSVLSERGRRPVRATERISACVLDDHQAELLAVSPGAPALFILRTAFDAEGRVVEVTGTYYRSDVYDLIAELTFQSVGSAVAYVADQDAV
ncbi:GntR family transcriptional regulator [Martelella endophytica]|uniref:GntR family transcriptional regulator n=1 Tax=Martelella endophytica TaxID=1486262 RepID=UPI0005F15C6D|nr:GntR family transcriptional regulator [Martelella endophytica]